MRSHAQKYFKKDGTLCHQMRAMEEKIHELQQLLAWEGGCCASAYDALEQDKEDLV